MREIARVRVRYGYRKIRVLLNREGWNVSRYLAYRLYQQEGLALRPRRSRGRRAVAPRRERFHSTAPNQVWSLDFIADQLVDGRRFRALTVVDIYTRESLAIEAGQSLKGEDVVMVLNRIMLQRSAPKVLFCDNGSDFASLPWTCGPTGTECASTSRGRGSRRTMLSSNRSMGPCEQNASTLTGSQL